MKTSPQFPHALALTRRGFTLVELLVAISVLVLMIVMVAQLTNSATNVTGLSNRQVSADMQAQIVFSQMQSDFSGMSKDKSQDDFFYKNTGSGTSTPNDVFYFYSEAVGFFFGNAIASSPYNQAGKGVVGYRVNNLKQWGSSYTQAAYPNQSLYRLGRGLVWDGSIADAASSNPSNFLTFKNGIPDSSGLLIHEQRNLIGPAAPYDGSETGTTDPRYSGIIGEGVFRLEFCFQLKDGSYSNNPILSHTNATLGFPKSATFYTPGSAAPGINNAGPTFAIGSRWWDSKAQRGYICVNATKGAAKWASIGMKDVAAVVVGMAILERDARKTLKADSTYSNQVDSKVMADLTAKFLDCTDSDVAGTGGANPVLMGEKWNAVMNGGTVVADFQKIGVPPAATAQIRVYQRAFPLNTKQGAL